MHSTRTRIILILLTALLVMILTPSCTAMQSVPDGTVSLFLDDPALWIKLLDVDEKSLVSFAAYLKNTPCPAQYAKDNQYCLTVSTVPASSEEYAAAPKQLLVYTQVFGKATPPAYAEHQRYQVVAAYTALDKNSPQDKVLLTKRGFGIDSAFSVVMETAQIETTPSPAEIVVKPNLTPYLPFIWRERP